MDSDDILDLCSLWITERKASYLCKEDKIVWWASLTGRDSDKEWQSMSLSEAVRTIKFMKLGVDVYLTTNMLITAFQELDEVYETGIHSEYQVSEGIFNYSDKAAITSQESVARELISLMNKNNMEGLLFSDVIYIYEKVMTMLNIEETSIRRNAYFRKHSVLMGYVVREGSNRISYEGNKKTAILKQDGKPSNIKRLRLTKIANMAAEIFALVK